MSERTKTALAIIFVAAVLMLVILARILSPADFDKGVIRNIRRHSVAIAVYYFVTPEEAARRMEDNANRDPSFWREEIIWLAQDKAVAYLGSGTILRCNEILTAGHLFDHLENSTGMKIWVFSEFKNHPIEAILQIAVREEGGNRDYALIKAKEDFELPGIRVARDGFEIGDEVILAGCPTRRPFFMRFAYITALKWSFIINEENRLVLTDKEFDGLWAVAPGGPGDSGGGVFNERGELVSMIYLGTEIAYQTFVLCNSNETTREWLERNQCQAHGFIIPKIKKEK